MGFTGREPSGERPPAERPAPDLAALAARVGTVRPSALAAERVVPVVDALRSLFAGGGLRRGSVVAVGGSPLVAVALVARATQAGAWAAAVGIPSLGMVAAAQVGVALERFALVPEVPADRWGTVAAAVLDGVDILLAVVPPAARRGDVRRLAARARERGAVVVGVGGWPEAADVRVGVAARRWIGIGQGHGHLQAREIEVVATGRGAAARERRVRVLLPDATGSIAPVRPTASVIGTPRVTAAGAG